MVKVAEVYTGGFKEWGGCMCTSVCMSVYVYMLVWEYVCAYMCVDSCVYVYCGYLYARWPLV